ncbi:hypothetical protein CR152_25495 [Massilia violaceinigra]|uniref:Uncharacterized protein n=1 Tax=Massilia violaceinigra TaxID=2045208 RepID=A0A2D2DRB3_9BURK|nr:hypothetical protein CR152_25495 [Massilia violaceinigra]
MSAPDLEEEEEPKALADTGTPRFLQLPGKKVRGTMRRLRVTLRRIHQIGLLVSVWIIYALKQTSSVTGSG